MTRTGKLAVHFGAGNIGRGFLGQVYNESGYSTVFVDVARDVVDALNARGSYPVRIVGDEPRDLTIDRVSAIDGRDVAAVAQALAQADIASTAVGVHALAHIVPALAAGIEARAARAGASPLNIIVCENLLEAERFMRDTVRDALPQRLQGYLETHVGFVEASIGRMVPVMSAAQRAEDPLLICVEAYCELPVDAAGFRGAIPPLAHLRPARDFAAYVERKLFVHNAGHAATAYLGYLRGHEYIWQAIADPFVRDSVDRAMDETCTALAHRFDFTRAELDAHWADLKQRFANRALGDQVQRVAADPVRKLGPRDRLIGAARRCLAEGVEPAWLAVAAVAAIRYDHGEDSSAQRLQALRRAGGLERVLREVCGVHDGDPLLDLVREQDALLDRLLGETGGDSAAR